MDVLKNTNNREQTITNVKEKLKKCLETTEKSCPVGLLFSRAGVEIEGHLEKL